MDVKTNPPAFPYAFHFPDQYGQHGGINFGMSLRDYFAAAALQGWLASFGPDTQHPVKADTHANVARDAYALADAMLAARQTSGITGEIEATNSITHRH